MRIKAVLIDHYDSFIYNIKFWLKNHFDIDIYRYDIPNIESVIEQYPFIILSPGPKSPKDYPKTLDIIDRYRGKKPIFGICLGMQMVLHLENIDIIPISPPVHGKRSIISTDSKLFFNEIDNISVARYHSLGTNRAEINNFYVTARNKEGIIMGIRSKNRDIIAVQFHPESFLTEKNDILAQNLYNWVKEYV